MQKPYIIGTLNYVWHNKSRWWIYPWSFVEIWKGASFFCVDLAWNYPHQFSLNTNWMTNSKPNVVGVNYYYLLWMQAMYRYTWFTHDYQRTLTCTHGLATWEMQEIKVAKHLGLTILVQRKFKRNTLVALLSETILGTAHHPRHKQVPLHQVCWGCWTPCTH